MFGNRTWHVPTAAAIPQPVRLSHIDSELCWCEPMIETDEDGHEVIVHREITWN